MPFMMFFETDCDAERFHCHHTPKHFAADVVEIVFPAITIDSGKSGCFDNLITSNFDTFNLSHGKFITFMTPMEEEVV